MLWTVIVLSLVHNALGQVDQAAILAAHNNERKLTPGLEPLVWDDSLAKTAQSYAETCPEDHSSDALRGSSSETIAWGWPAITAENAVKKFVDEKVDLVNGICIPGKQCGHYLIVVKKELGIIGCGTRTTCASFKQPVSQTWVCHYQPGKGTGGQPASPSILKPIRDAACNNETTSHIWNKRANTTRDALPWQSTPTPTGAMAAPATPQSTVASTVAPSTPSPTSGSSVAPASPLPTVASTVAPSTPSPTSGSLIAPATPKPTISTSESGYIRTKPTRGPDGTANAPATPAPTGGAVAPATPTPTGAATAPAIPAPTSGLYNGLPAAGNPALATPAPTGAVVAPATPATTGAVVAPATPAPTGAEVAPSIPAPTSPHYAATATPAPTGSVVAPATPTPTSMTTQAGYLRHRPSVAPHGVGLAPATPGPTNATGSVAAPASPTESPNVETYRNRPDLRNSTNNGTEPIRRSAIPVQ